MMRILDVQKLAVVEVDAAAAPAREFHAEVLVVGGGLGGVAAAISAAAAGRTVCFTEETDWLGGQATSQGVSALDENRYVDTTGATRSYMAFKEGIRDWYRKNTRLKPAAAADKLLNPGKGWVSRLCFEPKAALASIDAMLAPARDSGHLRILKRHKACGFGRQGSRIRHVDLVDLDSREKTRITAGFFIDATELGDLLALGAAEFVTGFESRAQTAEPHAADTADAEDVQSFTYPFVLENVPAASPATAPGLPSSSTPELYVGPPIASAGGSLDRKPPGYDRNLKEQPYSLTLHYATRGDITYGMFERREKTYGSFWHYRRLIDAAQFDDPRYRNDLAMINWPGNDYRGGNILVNAPEEAIAQLRAAKDLSLGLAYWLQHEVQRDDGGRGYPEFRLRRDVLGAEDGLSKFPYIRESRRIRAVKTILEPELTAPYQQGVRAAHFADSVGIGLYAIDLHESKRGRKQIINPAKPFQVPLGALIPVGVDNLLAGCKNIGTTHITNGCYRLHPIEWAIGEAGGQAAAACLEWEVTPLQLRNTPEKLLMLQERIVRRGAPIMWYDNVPVNDPQFESVQLLPFRKPEVLSGLRERMQAP